MSTLCSNPRIFFFFFTPHLNLSATSGSYEHFIFLVGGFSLVFGIPQISHWFPSQWQFIFLFTIPSTLIHSKILEFIKICPLNHFISHSTLFSHELLSIPKEWITICTTKCIYLFPCLLFSSLYSCSQLFTQELCWVNESNIGFHIKVKE